jgi:uncharacterized protein with von Willebrand factor type A (vWA) domain
MFTKLFYLLRDKGLHGSMQEWLCLQRALSLGLHQSSLTEFYYLARSILVKTEGEYDKFDLAFAEYFEEIESVEAIPEELLRWLADGRDGAPALADASGLRRDLEEIRRMLRERIAEQTERHDGGSYWVGTGGTSPFGNAGQSAFGIRVGGQSRYRSALQVAGDRKFQDFREDEALSVRQFQVALRRLRQFSTREEGPRDHLNLPKTIEETCDNAGALRLVLERPRRNMVKLLLLFDSGGSMWNYSRICSALFSAVDQSNHFKDLQIYYFHNCVYDRLYTSPGCYAADSVDTEWVLNNRKSGYRVVVVGDASMAPLELLRPGYRRDYSASGRESGLFWLRRLTKRYESMIWLNHVPPARWERGYGSETIRIIKQEVPMYHLTVQGLEDGLKHLMAGR